MSNLLRAEHSLDSVGLDQLSQELISNSLAKNTRRAYRSDWGDFLEFCKTHNTSPLPSSEANIRWYITSLARGGLKVSTIARRLSSISQAHALVGLDSPTTSKSVRLCFKGIKREYGMPQNKKKPVFTNDIRVMIGQLGVGARADRNRALLLLGFAGAFRRSELISLDVEDIELVREGMVVYLSHSKTDQDWEGRTIGVPYGSHPSTCPIRAYEDWLEVSGIESGPIFRPIKNNGEIMDQRLSDRSVANIIQRAAEKSGLNPRFYAGHSLRSGHATQAAKNGAPERKIMDQTGHKNIMTLRGYIREGELFKDNAAAYLGL